MISSYHHNHNNVIFIIFFANLQKIIKYKKLYISAKNRMKCTANNEIMGNILYINKSQIKKLFL